MQIESTQPHASPQAPMGRHRGVEHRTDQSRDLIVFGTFLIDDAEFAVSVNALKEVVNEPASFTRILPSPDYFLGVLNLRGLVVPVIDLRILLGLAPPERPATERKVAIIEHGKYCFGLMVDATGDVFTVKSTDHHPFANAEPVAAGSIINGVFMRDGGQKIVQILDPGALLELDHIPKVECTFALRLAETISGKRAQCLSFHVGESVCAIDVNCIKEIVDFEKIENESLASSWTLGTINLRGTTVPVIDLQTFLSGRDKRTAQDLSGQKFKLIVLQIGKELLSFLVDGIKTIVPFYEKDVSPFPPVGLRRSDLFKGCLSNDGSAMVLLMDYEKVLTDTELVNVTVSCRELFRESDATIRANHERNAKKQTYITFSIQSEFALDIRNVNEVLNFPDNVTRPPYAPQYIEGMLSLRGDLIPIINPRRLYKLDPIEASSAKLIIFSNGEAKYGMMVDSVGSIVNVAYTDPKSIPPFCNPIDNGQINNDVKETLVITGDPMQQRSLVILNLEAVLARCAVLSALEPEVNRPGFPGGIFN